VKELEPLGPHFGAIVHGLDLATVTGEQVAEIRAALVDRKVLFFRDQVLDDDGQIALGRRIGELTASHPVIGGVDAAHPEVYALDSADNGFADVWHTDVTFMERPPLGSILRAVVVPPNGGDTLFSDQIAAYNGLSPDLQGFLSNLTAVHDGKNQFQGILDLIGEGRWEGEAFGRLEPVEHPVVRTHPETGEKILFVNPGFTTRISQLTLNESDALLQFLYAHSVKPEYTVRYHWAPGAVGFWDNRSTQHAVTGDFGDQHRVIQRVTLRGDEPR
jgi:taurine dioxygenase